MGITTVISAYMVVKGWRWRRILGGNAFFLLMLAVTVYAGTYTVELAVESTAAKILWCKLGYFGIVCLAPLWLTFALSFSGHGKWLTRGRALALWVIPVLHLGLVLTNELHNLVWPVILQLPQSAGARLQYGHGLAVWLFTAYAYPLFIVGTYLLIRAAARSTSVYRLRLTGMIIGAVVPLAANALYLLEWNPFRGLDLTPIGFLIAGTLVSVGLVIYRNSRLLPVAQDVIFQSMGDGVLVLDTEDRLVQINPVGAKLTGLSKDALGHNLFQLFPGNGSILALKDMSVPHAVLEIVVNGSQQLLEASISPLWDHNGSLQGRVVLLRDIRQEQVMRDAERRRARQMEALNIITHAALRAPDLAQMIQVLANSLGVLFDADGAYITLWDDAQQRVIPAAAYGQMRYTYSAIKPDPEEKTITQSVLDAGRVLQVENTFHSPYLSSRVAAMFPAESILALPLIVDQRKLGAVLIAFNRSRRFTPEDVALGEQVAAQVAVSIAKVQLFEAEREQRKLAEALRVMGMTISESLDFETVLDRLLDEIGKVVPYDAACIMLVDADKKRARVARLRYISESTSAAQEWKTTPLVVNIEATPNLAQMIQTGQPLIIDDIEQGLNCAGLPLSAHLLRSWAGAPILSRGVVIGFLSLHKVEPGFYQPGYTSSLAAFTGQAANAIENARIFTEMQRTTAKERLLFAATRDFTAGLDTEPVLQAIGRHMLAGLQADGCMISRYDPDTGSLTSVYDALSGQHTAATLSRSPLSKYPITRTAVTSGTPQTQYIDDYTLSMGERALMQKYHAQALLLLPLVVGRERKVFGLVELFRQQSAAPFTENDIELAQSLAAQAAIALENARLYAETQHLAIVDELTGLYNRRGLFELGQRELERATRFKYPLAALFLDIDHFKIFNDRYSYAVGDRVLCLVAECVRINLRDFDIIGRYGGEEIVMLLPEVNPAAAVEIAERLRQSVQSLRVNAVGEEVGITVSIGVCTATQAMTRLDELLDGAGQAVHKAKSQGRNCVVLG